MNTEKKQKEIIFNPIGIIHSPFKDCEGMPIQTIGAQGVKAQIKIFPEFKDGLKDLDGFSHIILIYNFHLSIDYNLSVKPFMEDTIRGVFATRAPRRPNQIGMSIVKLESVKDNILHISNVDIADGTPILDIKPYIKRIACIESEKIGWLEKKADKFDNKISDDRFIKNNGKN
ncbi:MAG: tRNA (N6-threonylcarbamoyladenosine(37)-N6)-methyltransferase TrmO [Candidatus Tenebribacter burtonii]|jgi:tRNA-Thr(GGU) m(6)t(6)A37 methyltransferase TsaA|nr:tRNA (N6-threonylcarbamoyladenosine(37)-N6)-methyltransferase TrmO [Candidatus Tenebribacter burtonii]